MCDNSGITSGDLAQGARVGGSVSANLMDDDQARRAADPLGLFNKPPQPPETPDRPEPTDTNAFMRSRQQQRQQERSRQGRQSTILTSSGGRSGPNILGD